jgi:hypothetical protein
VPTVGPAVQVVLTYALGQLVIHSVTHDEYDASASDAKGGDEAWLEARWNEIEADIFSGDARTLLARLRRKKG